MRAPGHALFGAACAPGRRDPQLVARQLVREASAELARLRRMRGASRKTWRRIARAQARLAFAAALLGVRLAEPAFAGTRQFETPFVLADVGYGARSTFADIDGDGSSLVLVDDDGDLDALVGEYYGKLSLFENVALGPGTCADGRDNDFDGRIDSPSDPGCADAADPNERSTRQCDNGLDDAHDGRIDRRGDATGDPHCVSLTDNNESLPPPSFGGCGLGPELLLLAPLLAVARRPPSSAAPRPRRKL